MAERNHHDSPPATRLRHEDFGWEDPPSAWDERDLEGSFSCPHCGAVVHWEGEPPSDCLRCGEDL